MIRAIKPKHLIEALVVVVVLAILFAVMIPQFKQAQVSHYVTQAMTDLDAIADAARAYHLEHPTVLPGQIYIRNERTSWFESVFAYHAAELMKRRSVVPSHMQFERIEPYFQQELIQPDSPNPRSYLNRYTLTSHAWRELQVKHGYGPIRGAYFPSGPGTVMQVQAPKTQPFETGESIEWIGVAEGLCDFTHAFYANDAQRELNPYDSDYRYVEYSPTNGLLSHGFVVYRSAPGDLTTTDDLLETLNQQKPAPASSQP